jgi:peptidoglycan hydrolase-like protein with peptidoglycan-binding domain
MGLIIAATSAFVAGSAFAADPAAGSNPASTPAPAQTAPANTNKAATTPASTNESKNANGSAGASDNAAATPGNDMNKPDTTKIGQATQAEQKPMKKRMALSRKQVEHMQTALANSGQDVDIDGIWGPKTTAALKDFQKSHGLKPTGHLNHKTREALPTPI